MDELNISETRSHKVIIFGVEEGNLLEIASQLKEKIIQKLNEGERYFVFHFKKPMGFLSHDHFMTVIKQAGAVAIYEAGGQLKIVVAGEEFALLNELSCLYELICNDLNKALTFFNVTFL